MANTVDNISKTQRTIPSSDIALGMYVAELDKPWLESPFMLQGFIVENEEQLNELKKFCQTVVIDHALSVGDHYIAPPEVIKPKMDFRPSQQITIQENDTRQNTSTRKVNHNPFLSVIQSIKQGKKPILVRSTEDIVHVSQTSRRANLSTNAQPQSLKEHMQHDLSNLISDTKAKIKSLLSRQHASDTSMNARALVNTSDSLDETRVTPVEYEIAEIYPEFEKTQQATKAIFDSIAKHENIDLIHVSQSLDTMLKSIERNPDALQWLAKLKQTDDYSYSHALNVSINLMAFGHFLALPRNQVKDLGLTGLLQDVGKTSIPKEILQKKTPLSEDEIKIIRQHVHAGLDTLKALSNISQEVLSIVIQHHERYDGSGYPNRLKGKQISMLGQMAGIMDTYCAMTTNKPYAQGMFSQRVLEEIYALKDKAFSGLLIDQLIQFFGIYPVSSLVELNTGEVAVVIQQNQVRRLQPRVMVLLSADKSKNEHPVTLDLIMSPKTPVGNTYKIVKGLPPDSFGLNPADFYA